MPTLPLLPWHGLVASLDPLTSFSTAFALLGSPNLSLVHGQVCLPCPWKIANLLLSRPRLSLRTRPTHNSSTVYHPFPPLQNPPPSSRAEESNRKLHVPENQRRRYLQDRPSVAWSSVTFIHFDIVTPPQNHRPLLLLLSRTKCFFPLRVWGQEEELW